MSNPNFVSDLVAMAKAFEELPKVQAELHDYKLGNETLNSVITQREESILRLKSELEASHEARRKVEAERDDAELRFLESEDRVTSALSFIKNTFGSAGSLIQALEPPAPAPVAMPPAEEEVIHQEPWQPEPIFEKPINIDPPGYAPSWSQPAPTDAAMGQSDANPTPSVPVDTTHSNVDHTQPNASMDDGVSVPPSPTSAPVAQTGTGMEPEASSSEDAAYHTRFTGKRYYDHPTYMSLAAWLDGGGTEADYHWRPAPYKSGY